MEYQDEELNDFQNDDQMEEDKPSNDSQFKNSEQIQQYLENARNCAQENPTKALQYVLDALHACQKNSNEIFHIFQQAKEEHIKMEQLTSQLGSMAIPSKIESWNGNDKPTYSKFSDINIEESIIAEQGKEGIIRAAYEDGSSSICTLCGSLISNKRREAHFKYWCISLH